MKNIAKIGDIRIYQKVIDDSDLVNFQGETLHKVYSTFALGRDMEWTSRLFFIDMKEDHEEGVGTFLNIKHHSPALPQEQVVIKATMVSLVKNELTCDIEVTVDDRLIATGQTGQKMLTKSRLEEILRKADTSHE